MVKIDWDKILRFLLGLIFWSGLVLVPLAMSWLYPIYSPFTLVKVTWLQILGAASVIIFLLWRRPWRSSFSVSVNWRPYVRAVAPVWIFFIAWSLLSFFSVCPAQTWFGSYERQFGLFVYFWLAVWYSFGVYYFSGLMEGGRIFSSTDWKKYVKGAALVASVIGTIIGGYAFLQFCGFDFAVWQEAQLYSRAISTLGQPNFLGSFLLLTLPLTAYYFISSSSFRAKAAAFVLAAIQAAGLVVSGSRSAWLALLAVIAGVIAVSCWRRWRYRVLYFVLAISAVFFTALYVFMPGRINTLLDFNGGSLALRRSFYQASIGAIAERPWLGIGLENGGESLVKYYQPDWGVFMKIDGYTDKVHNSAADVLVQTGVVGFIFWLALYFYFARQCWLLWKQPAGKNFALMAAAALAAYSISLLFGLADVAGVFYFWLIASFVTAGNLCLRKLNIIETKQNRLMNICRSFSERCGRKMKTIFRAAVCLVIIGACFGQIYFSLNVLQADYYYLQIYRYLPQEDYFTVADIYSYLSFSALNPSNKTTYQRALGSFLVSRFDGVEDLSSRQLLKGLFVEFRDGLPQTGYENRVARARLECFLSGKEAVISEYQKLIALSPERPMVYRDYAHCLEKGGDSEGALAAYDQALALLPRADDSRINNDHRDYLRYYIYNIEQVKGDIFVTQKNDAAALASYHRAYSNYPDDVNLLIKIADAYTRLDKPELAAAARRHAFDRQP